MSFDIVKEYWAIFAQQRAKTAMDSIAYDAALRILESAIRADKREHAAQIADTYRGVAGAAALIAAEIRALGERKGGRF